MKKYLAFLFYFLSIQISFAQVSFEKTFGDTSDIERSFCVKQTYDSGFIVLGTNYQDDSGPAFTLMLIKTDSLGNEQWRKTWADFSLWQAQGASLKITPDSGFIITGGTYPASGSPGFLDVFLLKIDKNGAQQWVQTYDSITSNPSFGFYSESGKDVLLTNDGGYLVTGHAVYEAFLLKTDSVGNIQWLAKDTGQYRAVGNSLIEVENNNYLVIGYTTPNLSTTWKMYLTKFDSAGNKIWGQTYSWNQGNYSLGFSVRLNSNGEYVLLGEGRYNGSQYGEMLLIKTDTAGNPIWENSFVKYNYSSGWALDVTNDDGYILTGEAFDVITGYQVYLVKTDSSGTKLWDATYSGDWGYAVQQTFDNGYVVAGVKQGDIYLLKTNSNGILVSTTELISPEISLNIYPNPASGQVSIELKTQIDFQYSINVYDGIGRKINSLKNFNSNKYYLLDKIEFVTGVNYMEFVSDAKKICVRKIIIF
jgi:hypothetical protein